MQTDRGKEIKLHFGNSFLAEQLVNTQKGISSFDLNGNRLNQMNNWSAMFTYLQIETL